ncbi:MmcQ/YjbR family DNA-binding protein [Streptomyces sp. 8K308]|nr:MmcQ/YjbR family DNA-binding protein [Streptomyces sp. 8K308]
MNGPELQKTAADRAEELPGATLEHPFGPDWEVFKVRGKVFMLMTEVPGRPVVILKADPGESQYLREHNSHITPGHHMNKRHWITLEGGESIDRNLVEGLVTDSSLLVVAGLPRAQRPVDPQTFGRPRRRRGDRGVTGSRWARPWHHRPPDQRSGPALLRPGGRLTGQARDPTRAPAREAAVGRTSADYFGAEPVAGSSTRHRPTSR